MQYLGLWLYSQLLLGVRVYASVLEANPSVDKDRIIKLFGGKDNVWSDLPGGLLPMFMKTKFCIN